jgi:hypothetical protein
MINLVSISLAYAMGGTRTSHKQDEGDEVVVDDTDWSATPMSDNVPLPQHDAAGLAYFQQSKAKPLP